MFRKYIIPEHEKAKYTLKTLVLRKNTNSCVGSMNTRVC